MIFNDEKNKNRIQVVYLFQIIYSKINTLINLGYKDYNLNRKIHVGIFFLPHYKSERISF